MSDDEILGQIYDDQRCELKFRRDREQQIFTWSTNIQLTIIGGLFIGASKDGLLSNLRRPGFLTIGVLAIVAFTAYSVRWQLRQRGYMRSNQRILAKVAIKRGWFQTKMTEDGESILPARWKLWGHSESLVAGSGKLFITAFLGMIACCAALLMSRS